VSERRRGGRGATQHKVVELDGLMS